MKAAVLHSFGAIPRYEDFEDPIAGINETLIHVKAAVLENFDKLVASGKHYASNKMFPRFPAIAGHSGIGITNDGRLVGFGNMKPPYGGFAEKTVASMTIPVPEGTDPVVAAALPAAALTSLLPLKYTVRLQEGETVLVMGATGVSGKLAIQIAKMLGAGKVVAAGRNKEILASLPDLGADRTIDLGQTDEELIKLYRHEGCEKGIDVVIDFIWGHPAEVLLKSFVPEELGFPKSRIRYLHIGEKAGPAVSLTGEMIRTSGLEIYGASNMSPEAIGEGVNRVWGWIKENKLQIDIEKMPLSDIEKAWQRTDLAGKRIVIIP